MKPNTIDPQIHAAGTAASGVRDVRQDAQTQAILACREMETALTRALDGEPLRGLANLGNATARFHGARVRSRIDDALSLEPNVGEAGMPNGFLCLSPHGLLVLAQAPGEGAQHRLGGEAVLDHVLVLDVLLEEGQRGVAGKGGHGGYPIIEPVRGSKPARLKSEINKGIILE